MIGFGQVYSGKAQDKRREDLQRCIKKSGRIQL
jgi:hypothetical protein